MFGLPIEFILCGAGLLAIAYFKGYLPAIAAKLPIKSLVKAEEAVKAEGATLFDLIKPVLDKIKADDEAKEIEKREKEMMAKIIEALRPTLAPNDSVTGAEKK